MSQTERDGTGSNNDQQQQEKPAEASADEDGTVGNSRPAIAPKIVHSEHMKSNGGSTTGHGHNSVVTVIGGGPAPIATDSGTRSGSMGQSQSQTDPDDESQATATNLEENSDGEEYSGSQQSTNTTHDPGKMFIGGLSWQTTAEGLRDYFCKFGEVNECMVMRDPTTKRARGFGFITFADPNTVEKVLEVPVHELDGKQIDPKVAFPKKTQPKMVVKTKKIFIGGLSASSTLEDIKAYFQQYGKIEDAMLMYDKATQRHRGFGFITFDDDNVSDKVCEIHFHEINGKMVECKKAQPKEVMLPVQINKSKAAAARNLYGLAPEQLLAYASCMPMPRLSPYGGPAGPGVIYPGVFNGFSPPANFGLSPSGRSSVSNSAMPLSSAGSSGMVNPRDLAAAQLAAQQQAVYEAAFAYAQMSGGGQSGGDFGFGPHHHHHHQHAAGPPPQHQSPQQSNFHHHMAQIQQHHQPQQQQPQQFAPQMHHHSPHPQLQHPQQHQHIGQHLGHLPLQPSMPPSMAGLNSPGIGPNSPSSSFTNIKM